MAADSSNMGKKSDHYQLSDHISSHNSYSSHSSFLPIIYIVFLIVSCTLFELVTCRQVSDAHSKYQVSLKCADNLMNIQIKMNPIQDDKNSVPRSKLSVDKNSNYNTNIKSNDTHSVNLNDITNYTLIKPINFKKSINTTSQVTYRQSIEPAMILSNKPTNELNDDESTNHSQIINLITDTTLKPTTVSFAYSTNINQTINTANSSNFNDQKSPNNLSINKLTNHFSSSNLFANRPVVVVESSSSTTITLDHTHQSNSTIRSERSITNVRRKINDLRMYFEGWKTIEQCRPQIIERKQTNESNDNNDQVFHFQIELQPVNDTGLNCGLIRMRNKITDEVDYQHTIVIEYNEQSVDRMKNELLSSEAKKDALIVHCKMPRANFFQANQFYWWSRAVQQQQILKQRLSSLVTLDKSLKQTNNRSDNEQTTALKMTGSNSNTPATTFTRLPSEYQRQPLTFGYDQLDQLYLNRSFDGHRMKRASQFGDFLNSLPENFTESVEELTDYSGTYTGKTPVPKIQIAVRQNSRSNGNQFGNNSLDYYVPGTPLELVIKLDDESANVYGLLVSYLKVSDNANSPRQQEEIIVLDGCSIDQYIFENFESIDNGKSIIAKFRAFRFPGSNYVLFVGTINVCIGQCTPVICDQQNAYGRRRRKRRDLNKSANDYNNLNNQTIESSSTLSPSLRINNNSDFELKVSSNRRGRKLASSMQPDVNKLFEVEMSTIIKVSKLREISSLIKSEYHTVESPDTNNRTLIRSTNRNRIKRPEIGARRTMKKRYDSNQSIGKLTHLSYFKETSLRNCSINDRPNISYSILFFIISHFAFSAIFRCARLSIC